MWSTPVVVLLPFFQRMAGVDQRVEERFIEAFISQLAVGTATLLSLDALFGRNSRLMILTDHKDIHPKFHGMVPGNFRSLVGLENRYLVEKNI